MTQKLQRFFRKNSIPIQDVLYLTREDGKSRIWLLDGRTVETFIPLKELSEALASRDLVCINKGIYISAGQIRHVENGIYEMQDGKVFQGRRRTGTTQRQLESHLRTLPDTPAVQPAGLRERFAVLDDMPEAFCVIELIFNADGTGVDFIFRYCNRAMEALEGKALTEMLDHSFYRVFPNADKKWLVSYADVALNGGQRTIRSYSPEIDRDLVIQCYQPMDGFCACLLRYPDRG